MQGIIDLLEFKKNELFIYSSLNFIRDINKESLVEETLINPIIKDIKSGITKITEIKTNGESHFFILKQLDWDTKYFGFPIFKIELILYKHNKVSILNSAINKFVDLFASNNEYFMINIPCEDLILIQAFCSTKFRLVETRLNYYLSNIQNYESPRYATRNATISDSNDLRKVAIKMRNQYDRVHADPAFSTLIADDYLGDFIVESVKGFADIVLIPDVLGKKPFGFLAGNYPSNILDVNVSKLVLAAIDSSVEEGWLNKLLSEMIYNIKDAKADYLTTITQASNKPAIRTWEKAGFKLGFTTHLFSYKKL